jgi:arginine decarboxylase
MSRARGEEYNRLVSVSIGVATPADQQIYGYLSEHHAYGLKLE